MVGAVISSVDGRRIERTCSAKKLAAKGLLLFVATLCNGELTRFNMGTRRTTLQLLKSCRISVTNALQPQSSGLAVTTSAC